MPYKEKPITRRYWTVPLIARELNTSVSSIRFWIREFELEIHTHINKRPVNAYQRAWIVEIHRLLKIELHTMYGAKCKLRDFDPKKKAVGDY